MLLGTCVLFVYIPVYMFWIPKSIKYNRSINILQIIYRLDYDRTVKQRRSFFHNLDHFQEPHGVWEGHVSMWGASQRNWCIMPPFLVMPSEIPKPMAGMFPIKSRVTGNLLLIDIFSHCWQIRILFVSFKTISVCIKFWQAIVFLSHIKFREF